MLAKIIADTSLKLGKHVTKGSIIEVEEGVFAELFHASKAVRAPADAKPYIAPGRDFAAEEDALRARFQGRATAAAMPASAGGK